jgi:hypothetical protein
VKENVSKAYVRMEEKAAKRNKMRENCTSK